MTKKVQANISTVALCRAGASFTQEASFVHPVTIGKYYKQFCVTAGLFY
jgi:hypothetical protein